MIGHNVYVGTVNGPTSGARGGVYELHDLIASCCPRTSPSEPSIERVEFLKSFKTPEFGRMPKLQLKFIKTQL